MNIFRPQVPYEFTPPKYSVWFRPVLHMLCAWRLRNDFNIREIQYHGHQTVASLIKSRHSVLVTPNHADHADPSLLVHIGRKLGAAFHFMAAREGFERSRLIRFVLQRSGAFSVDREGADLASIKTAIKILRECQFPLIIFPEGEIYHHHEELDALNDGVATILLRASEKLPDNKSSYVVPTAIRITHDPSVEATFSERLNKLEKRITWKPKTHLDAVERIYRLGGALLSIKEEEFLGQAQQGDLSSRIQNLQCSLIEHIEQKHGALKHSGTIPARIKSLRQLIRKELSEESTDSSNQRTRELYDELDHIFLAQQLYSYPGQYLREQPSLNRIAETIYKLEEDVLEQEIHPTPRNAHVVFGEPIDVRQFLQDNGLTTKSGVRPMTSQLRVRIQDLLNQSGEG